MQDPYRIKVENGKISINIFQEGNPIPHTSYKGKLDSKKTKEFIEIVRNKFSDKHAIDFLSSFIKSSGEYKERINQDWKTLSKELNGKRKQTRTL